MVNVVTLCSVAVIGDSPSARVAGEYLKSQGCNVRICTDTVKRIEQAGNLVRIQAAGAIFAGYAIVTLPDESLQKIEFLPERDPKDSVLHHVHFVSGDAKAVMETAERIKALLG